MRSGLSKRMTFSDSLRCYTMVEILVVLAIAAILLGSSMAAFNTVIKRQRTTGAVRNLSSAIAMARSYAVAKNRCVALVIPDTKDNLPSYGSAINSKSGCTPASFNAFFYENYLFSCYGVCYVKKNGGTYDFDGWVAGDDLVKLPTGVSAFIKTGAQTVENVIFRHKAALADVTIKESAGLIFRPSGCLEGTGEKEISVLPAKFHFNNVANKCVFIFIGKSKNYWNVIINSFTGRASYENSVL
ncbi:GspH/FimT family pseudopilin [Lentisphaerota bacterium ZTH]|nr:GspH/FimT family pseudopilin [Lentisphaerota bacterium ZTH]